jgi:hypothetical protein
VIHSEHSIYNKGIIMDYTVSREPVLEDLDPEAKFSARLTEKLS